MKKQIFFLLLAISLFAGCTTKEQEQQIRLFWLQQYTNLMMKKLENMKQTLPSDFQLKNLTSSWSQSLPSQHVPAAAQTPRPTGQTAAPARPQIMEVTLDTDTLPGKASAADRTRMKRALEAVQISNQSTLSDIAVTFGDNVKYKAFLITADTERKLKETAKKSANFSAYFTEQQKLLKEQDRKINDLLLKNTGSIKNLPR